MPVLSVKVSDDYAKRVREFAKSRGISVAKLIREALDSYMAEQANSHESTQVDLTQRSDPVLLLLSYALAQLASARGVDLPRVPVVDPSTLLGRAAVGEAPSFASGGKPKAPREPLLPQPDPGQVSMDLIEEFARDNPWAEVLSRKGGGKS